MNRKMWYILPTIFIMMSFIVAPVTAFAVTYEYKIEMSGYDGDGDPIYKAFTNDPDFMLGTGFVRFWMYDNPECNPPAIDSSPNQPHIMLVDDGLGYWVGYYSFDGYGDAEVCVKPHFQGGGIDEDKSVFGECILVPWFTSLPMAMLVSIGGIALLKRRKKI